jgi:N utilization substance protein B
MLFQIDVGKQPVDETVEDSMAQSVLEGPNKEFASKLIRGTLTNEAEIDRMLAELATDWTVDRLAAVDRNILRMTAFEMMFQTETPVGAVINEAVELAKKYSTAESGRFVNGILGALAKRVEASNVAGK